MKNGQNIKERTARTRKVQSNKRRGNCGEQTNIAKVGAVMANLANHTGDPVVFLLRCSCNLHYFGVF
jgi:hypothetical protein